MTFFRQIPFAADASYAYLLADLDRREAALIDPSDEQVALYLGFLEELQAKLTAVLITHSHRRRLPGADALRNRCGTQIMAGPASGLEKIDRILADGDILAVGNELLRVWHTPGHTAGCVSYLWRDRIFTGDTLLIGDCGATEEASSDPGLLYDSLTRRILTLPDDTLVYPAHDPCGRRVSSIAEQRYSNPRLTGTTRDEFISASRRERHFA